MVIVLDGLDQLEVSHLRWLPSKLPNNAKIILSAATDSPLTQLFRERVTGDTCVLEVGTQLNGAWLLNFLGILRSEYQILQIQIQLGVLG